MNIIEEILEPYITKKVQEKYRKACKELVNILHERFDNIKLGLWESKQLERLIEDLLRVAGDN